MACEGRVAVIRGRLSIRCRCCRARCFLLHRIDALALLGYDVAAGMVWTWANLTHDATVGAWINVGV